MVFRRNTSTTNSDFNDEESMNGTESVKEQKALLLEAFTR